MRITPQERGMALHRSSGLERWQRHHSRLQIPVYLLTAIRIMERIWRVELVYHAWKERGCGLMKRVCILHQEGLGFPQPLVISHRLSGKVRFRWDVVFGAAPLETL